MAFSYRCRPGYGSQALLIEFIRGSEDATFHATLFDALMPLNPVLIKLSDLWMNDEWIQEMASDAGAFSIHQDIWDMVFIMADNNQTAIIAIDALLDASPHFEKEIVDFEDYKLVK